MPLCDSHAAVARDAVSTRHAVRAIAAIGHAPDGVGRPAEGDEEVIAAFGLPIAVCVARKDNEASGLPQPGVMYCAPKCLAVPRRRGACLHVDLKWRASEGHVLSPVKGLDRDVQQQRLYSCCDECNAHALVVPARTHLGRSERVLGLRERCDGRDLRLAHRRRKLCGVPRLTLLLLVRARVRLRQRQDRGCGATIAAASVVARTSGVADAQTLEGGDDHFACRRPSITQRIAELQCQRPGFARRHHAMGCTLQGSGGRHRQLATHATRQRARSDKQPVWHAAEGCSGRLLGRPARGAIRGRIGALEHPGVDLVFTGDLWAVAHGIRAIALVDHGGTLSEAVGEASELDGQALAAVRELVAARVAAHEHQPPLMACLAA
mmetsp:Transcript_41778/g.110151  ORF Transcript_41778/g.110151 Transcript_41778/m.110151 type:complete len:379 (-) Transcript_41778:134-1270(-)